MHTRAVVAIPPSYKADESLDIGSTKKYLSYLEEKGVETVMSTAGTSQYNLLTKEEIHLFNETIANNFKGECILGIPAKSTQEIKKFVQEAEDRYIVPSTKLMALYPERYYNLDTVFEYFKEIREVTSEPIYIHGMQMRHSTGSTWNYESEILNKLFSEGVLWGIKEENSNFKDSYNFVESLRSEIDVIVAGGSMRRHQYLHTAGANAFLSGVGNMFPKVEQMYCVNIDNNLPVDLELKLETRLFKIFMKHGWHRSLRTALKLLNLTCEFNRSPWPREEELTTHEIRTVLMELKNI